LWQVLWGQKEKAARSTRLGITREREKGNLKQKGGRDERRGVGGKTFSKKKAQRKFRRTKKGRNLNPDSINAGQSLTIKKGRPTLGKRGPLSKRRRKEALLLHRE